MKQILKENNGQYSSTRLFTMLILISALVDWQKAVWTVGIWHPDIVVIGLVCGVLGLKVVQKKFEK